MKRYGEDFELTQDILDDIAIYMNDDIREDLHFKIAPCSPEKFLVEYVKADREFEKLLKNEFSIEL